MKSRCGFTLIELIVVIFLLFIFAMIAVPSINHMIKKNQRDSTLNTLLHMAQFARGEAISRGYPVSLCVSHDLKECRSDWLGKTVVFVNPEVKNFISSPDQILRIDEPSHRDGKLSSPRLLMTFYPIGRFGVNATRIIYCPRDRDPNYRGELVLNNSGRVRINLTDIKEC